MTFKLQQAREELTHFLRNLDVIPISVRGVTTDTESLTGSAGLTITLSNTIIRNIRSLEIDGVSKYLFRDYTVNWSTGIITLNVALTGGESIEVEYDYGGTEKIYPDMPRDDLTLSSYPRIGIELTSRTTNPFGLYGESWLSDFLMTIYVWNPANIDTYTQIGGTEDLMDIIETINQGIQDNAKNFYIFPFIYPMGNSPIIRGQNNKLIQCSIDCQIKFVVENATSSLPTGLLSGLLAYWELDDNTDITGNSYDLTLGTGTYTPGKIGNALDNSYIYGQSTYTGLNTQVASSEMTVSLWTYSLGGGGSQGVFGLLDTIGANIDGGGSQFGFLYANGGTEWQFITDKGTNIVLQNTSNAGWQHHILIKTATYTRYYRNNVLVGTSTYTPTNSATTTEIVLGAYNNSGAIPWQGLIDEVGIWNRVLSVAEIDELYNSGNGLAYPF